MRILITGATGFVGRAVVARALADGEHRVRCVVRQPSMPTQRGAEKVVIADIGGETSWTAALEGVDAVVHLAAKVHDLKAHGPESLEAYRAINTTATVNLARQASQAGVKRFVFLSSVKVNGEEGLFRESDPPAPVDSYAISKSEAEVDLLRIGGPSSMQAVIIRPPLVYGPGVRANFRALVRVMERGLPLPLGSVHNARSFVGLDNLVDFILVSLDHPDAAGEIFFVSDGEDLSTTELLRRIAGALGVQPRLFPFPVTPLRALATVLGRGPAIRRLLNSLQVDISKARQRLGWNPPVSNEEGLRRMVASRP